MALLLAHARNLKVLYAEVPETDIFFEEVLRKAMGHQQHRAQDEYCPLHYLQEAHLTSSWNCRRGSQSRDNYKLALSHLSLVFQLPSIQKLSLFDFVSCGASNWIENNSKPSSLRDLTIVHHRDCVLEASDAKALLVLPRTLTKLSIYLDDQIDNRPLPSNADLWNVISQHNQSIEYLDVYRDSEALGGKNSHFGSMKGFKRLHTLYIQPEVLLGSYYGDPTGALQLVDTLPINLRSLTVYGEEGLSTNKTLVWRLQDVVNSRDFPHLSHVVLESTCEYIHHYKDAADPLHDEVERACKESGITYETKDVSSLTHGGVAHPHYKNTEKKRLQMDIKMDEVRVVITEHLHRLRRATSGDAGNTDTQEKFTTDDLDSYELPWEELYQSALSLDLGIFSDAGSICDGRSSYEEHPEESMPDFLEDSDIEDMESQDTDPQ
jgi:hypothetical protein